MVRRVIVMLGLEFIEEMFGPSERWMVASIPTLVLRHEGGLAGLLWCPHPHLIHVRRDEGAVVFVSHA